MSKIIDTEPLINEICRKYTALERERKYSVPTVEVKQGMADLIEAQEPVKALTFAQIYEIVDRYEKTLWRDHEEVLGNSMIDIGQAEENLRGILLEHGLYCEEDKNIDTSEYENFVANGSCKTTQCTQCDYYSQCDRYCT